jgi:hypothetical protein
LPSPSTINALITVAGNHQRSRHRPSPSLRAFLRIRRNH